MILDSLFRLAAHDFRKNGKLPDHVHIRRKGGFHRDYHIREVVALASKVCGLNKTVGIKREKNAIGILRKAARILHDQRLLSPVCGYVVSDIPKNKITGNVRVGDLRAETCNVTGLARVRLESAMNNTAKDVVLRPEHRYAAVELAKKIDVFIVDTDIQSARLQDFLARANLTTVVTTHEVIDEFYDAPLAEEASVWSEPLVANS
tara:strand:- start:348 stop:962 length:615 start_codon:yes stop_codon:yes gene_type:complete